MIDLPSPEMSLPGVSTGPARKVMSSSLAIATAVGFGAISALVSFAIDRNVLSGAQLRPLKGGWQLRGTIAPTDSFYQAPVSKKTKVLQRSEA